MNANENSSKGAVDRASRDKIKKIKNLLAENVPAEHLVTLKWVLLFDLVQFIKASLLWCSKNEVETEKL